MKYLYHHLGLGDHIICNAMVREYYKRYGELSIFCKKHNTESVSYMFRDLLNLKILTGDDSFAMKYLRKIPEKDIIRIGHTGIEWENRTNTFDHTFYKQALLNFDLRWSGFHINRDKNKEAEFFNRFGLNPGAYIFIHEDKERAYGINERYLNKDIKRFYVNKNVTSNIFDYLQIIDNAAEIHVIESCVQLITDSLPELNIESRLIAHRYARTEEPPQLKRKWNVIVS